MIKTIIVDDEFYAREALSNYLREFCPDIDVIASVNSADEALEAIKGLQPQLLFLDVAMPDKDGFDLLSMIPKINFKIIFVTAYSEYAVRAFRYYATDYLLKPLNISELTEAVGKVRKELAESSDNMNIEHLQKHRNSDKDGFDILVIRDSRGFKVLETINIIKCEAKGVFTIFHLFGGKQEVASKNLGFYEETLECPPFIRVHHSFIVNLKHVRGYISNDQVIRLLEDHTAPLGNKYKESFFRSFK